jgi:hypothetical protein
LALERNTHADLVDSQGIVIAQVNKLVDKVSRVDIPGEWVDAVIESPKPFFLEPLFTRDPALITDTQVLMAMMAIKGIYQEYGVKSLNHRFFDWNYKGTPLGDAENRLRSLAQRKLLRGRIEAAVDLDFLDPSSWEIARGPERSWAYTRSTSTSTSSPGCTSFPACAAMIFSARVMRRLSSQPTPRAVANQA